MYAPLLWSRRLVRTAVARTLGPFLQSDRVLVVGYHRVVERFDREAELTIPANLVSQGMLERHLDWIGRHHEYISLDELGRLLESGARPVRPVAAVTFDDGYRDVYENAFPMLIRKGIPAAVFPVTNLIGTSKGQTHDRLYASVRRALRSWPTPAATMRDRLRSADVPDSRRVRFPEVADAFLWTRALLGSLAGPSRDRVVDDLEAEFGTDDVSGPGFLPMTWEMTIEMHQAGITVGSHTASHALLTNESAARVYDEVFESRRRLEVRLGSPVRHFAYPDGRFNRTAVRAVRLAGYKCAFTTCEHRDRRQPLLTIPRRVFWEHSAVDTRGRFVPALLKCQERGLLVGRRPCSWQSHA